MWVRRAVMNIVNNRDLRIERLQLSRWEVNSYIIVCPQTGHSTLVDAPPGAQAMLEALEGTELKYILLTHNHIDHIAGLAAFKSKVKAPLAVHPADQSGLALAPERLLNDGDTITVGNIKISVVFTPGHTPGSICFRIGEYLIAGDTLFPGGPGRTETPADFQQIIKSITGKLLILPEETVAYPGHGDSTTIKRAKEEYASFAAKSHAADLCGDVTWGGG
jgi:hydroxyacylglutathione hydrolase